MTGSWTVSVAPGPSAAAAAGPPRAEDWHLTGRGPRKRALPTTALDPGTGAVKLTSGSTGCPRGIVAPASALFADDAALAATMGLAANERILGAIPMSHSYGLSSVALPALVRGSLVIVPEEGSGPYGPLRAAHALGATFFPTVPALLRALLASDRPPALPDTLRLTITAGAPLQPETARRFREVHGRAVHVFYGSSETGGICFDREGGAGEEGSVGQPVEGVTVTLAPFDGAARTGAEADVEHGVVTVASPAVAAGYLPSGGDASPRLADGRFRTGDVARWRDGALVLTGRTDDLVNVRGKKVNPREVEGVRVRPRGCPGRGGARSRRGRARRGHAARGGGLRLREPELDRGPRLVSRAPRRAQGAAKRGPGGGDPPHFPRQGGPGRGARARLPQGVQVALRSQRR